MVAASDIVLVLIGSQWAAGKNAERLGDHDDLVRQEVEMALEKGARVIPVLLNGAPLPNSVVLPPSLAPLLKRNAFELSERRWNYDVQDLVTTLEGLPAPAVPTAAPEIPSQGPSVQELARGRPAPSVARTFVPRPRTIAAAGLLLTAAVLGAIIFLDRPIETRVEMSANPASPGVAAARPPEMPPAEEDCRTYNPRALKIEDERGWGWSLTAGERLVYLDNRADARRALALARRYTRHCFIGRPKDDMFPGLGQPGEGAFIVDYWSGDSGLPAQGDVGREDCVKYSPAMLRVERAQSESHWVLRAGSADTVLARFATEADARRGLVVARAASEICYVGRDNPRPDADTYIMEYWR
jgi:hypothetical protein